MKIQDLLIACATLASAVIKDSCTNANYAALTFDEGPSKAYTRELLKILDDKKVKAAFHYSSEWLSDPEVVEIVKMTNDKGHLVGIRFSSSYNPSKMSKGEIRSVLEKGQKEFEKIIGKKPRFVRINYEDSKQPGIVSAIEASGFYVTVHNLDSADYFATSEKGIDKIVQTVKSAAAGHLSKNSIILVQRDGNEWSVRATDKIIDVIRESKHTIVRLDECVSEKVFYY